MSLLPAHHDQFRSKDYWERFFRERGGEQFEWYGSFNDVEANVLRSINRTDRILVIGCGNSEFSSELFDSGFRNVRNLDFSPLVIEEMKSKHLSVRPEMLWDLGDMTAMVNYTDRSFDVVFDKGALDALMSTNDAETLAKASAMFHEIDRVLALGGKYICITLAESFIFKELISHFSGLTSTAKGWKINVESIKSTKPSPFQPFYIVITKPTSDASSPAATATVTSTASVSLCVNSLGEEAAAELVPAPLAIEKIPRIQEYHQKQYELGNIRVGRFETIDFWAADSPAIQVPRFTVILLDAAVSAMRSCVAFFIPTGRESEYQFATQEGLRQVAVQAQCRRMIAVRCNRPHIFPQMDLLQAELSPVAMSLRPRDMPEDEVIPYMALENDGNWETIEAGTSAGAGDYIVEEDEDADNPNAVIRRLIFLQNQNFIQSEVRLVPAKANKAGGGSKGGGKSGGGKGKGKSKGRAGGGGGGRDKDGEEQFEFDYTYLDEHHKAVLSSLVLSPELIAGGHKVVPVATGAAAAGPLSVSSGVDKKKTGHPNTVGGSSTASTASASLSQRAANGFVVGLGGGAFPMCLQRYLPGLHLWVCDLDPDIESIASKHFGFKCNARTSVVVGEGMQLIHQLVDRIKQNSDALSLSSLSLSPSLSPSLPPPPVNILDSAATQGAVSASATATASAAINGPTHALDFLFIDADSKDPSLGLSAPPKTFITPTALRAMYQALRAGGLLALNVAARNSGLLDELLKSIHAVFTICDAIEENNHRNTSAPIANTPDGASTATTTGAGAGAGDDHITAKKVYSESEIALILNTYAANSMTRPSQQDSSHLGAAGSTTDTELGGLEDLLSALSLGTHNVSKQQGGGFSVLPNGKQSVTSGATRKGPVRAGGSRVYLLRPAGDTANVIVLAVKGKLSDDEEKKGTGCGGAVIAAATAGKSKGTSSASTSNSASRASTSSVVSGGSGSGSEALKEQAIRECDLENWLKSVNLASDPLGLISLSEKLKEF